MIVVVLRDERQILHLLTSCTCLLFARRPAWTARSHDLLKHVLSVQMETVEEMSTARSMWIKIKQPLTDILRGKQTKASAARTPPPPRPEKLPGRGILRH